VVEHNKQQRRNYAKKAKQTKERRLSESAPQKACCGTCDKWQSQIASFGQKIGRFAKESQKMEAEISGTNQAASFITPEGSKAYQFDPGYRSAGPHAIQDSQIEDCIGKAIEAATVPGIRLVVSAP
jgi:hypothetical protein